MLAHFLHGKAGGSLAFGNHALGDLELQGRWAYPIAIEHLQDAGNEVFLQQLPHGQVHRHRFQARHFPAAQNAAGILEHFPSKRVDEAVALGNGDELVGRYALALEIRHAQ